MKKVSYIATVVMVIVTVALHYFCDSINIFNSDLCWLLEASYVEFERAFPEYYALAFLVIQLAKGGACAISIIGLILSALFRTSKENVALSIISVLLTLIFSEIALRLIGYNPGQFTYSQWAKPVEELELVSGFVNDENGILKVDTSVAFEYARNKTTSSVRNYIQFETTNICPEISGLYLEHFLDVDAWKSRFGSKHKDYLNNPINKDGFYSLSFDSSDTVSKRVLLLGDSFTWGHSAENMVNSFANRLLANGNLVFNTGISGTDLQQYEVVLKTYEPRIQPELVILNFFVGNDITFFKRVVSKELPLMYHTNAGNIMSMQDGVQFYSLNKAYNNLMKNMVVPPTTFVNRYLMRTVITTFLWEFLANQKLISHQFAAGNDYPQKSMTESLLHPIINYCDSVKVPLLLVSIPKIENGKLLGIDEVEEGLFDTIEYYSPNLKPDLYNSVDGHFNDEGHKVYADYLQTLIDSCFQKFENGE